MTTARLWTAAAVCAAAFVAIVTALIVSVAR